MAGMALTDDPTTDALPRWDLTPLYPTVDGPEVAAAEAALAAGLADLTALYDAHDVAPGEARATPVDAAAFDAVLAATNDLLERFDRLESFAHGHVSTASGDEAAQALMSRLSATGATVNTLRTRFDAWVGRLDLDALVAASPAAAAHEWPLRKAARRARHQMSGAEEALASELQVTASSAWARLYEDVTSGVTAEVTPTGAARRCRSSPSAAWPPIPTRPAAGPPSPPSWRPGRRTPCPIAAALNALKGENLAARRAAGAGPTRSTPSSSTAR